MIVSNFTKFILLVSICLGVVLLWKEYTLKNQLAFSENLLAFEDTATALSSSNDSDRWLVADSFSRYFRDLVTLRSNQRQESTCDEQFIKAKQSSTAIAESIWGRQLEAQIYPIPRQSPLAHTHAHNDYEHEHPLFDALSFGFVSVEADIWLYPHDNGNLRVAHHFAFDPTKLPTLKELYLDPLKELKEKCDCNGIYPDGTPLILLVDIKSIGRTTYEKLDRVLAGYQVESPNLFTTFTQDTYGNYRVEPGAVTVIISGHRPKNFMASQKLRYADYDGRKRDLRSGDNPDFMPSISDDWNRFFINNFAWDGTGTIPSRTKEKLSETIGQVRRQGKVLRLWNLPQDTPNVWQILYEAGVDWINTDDLRGLASWIESQCSQKKIE